MELTSYDDVMQLILIKSRIKRMYLMRPSAFSFGRTVKFEKITYLNTHLPFFSPS